MRTLISRGLWLVLFLVPVFVGLSRGEQTSDAPTDPLQRWIKHLGSTAYAERQDASKKLIALGEKAIPALRQATKSNDLEVRRRAREILLAVLPHNRKSQATGLELMLIEGGSFHMGSPANEKGRHADEERHSVLIREPFYLGAREVTQAEYRKVMETNPSWFAQFAPGEDSVHAVDKDQLPVERVSWYDAIDFCNRLSNRDGFPAYYKVDEVNRVDNSIRSAKVTIVGGDGYRLPTEAEWEFACRAHSDGPYHFPNVPLGKDANFKSSLVPGGYGNVPRWQALNRTNKVGSYPANPYGLYDMHGNVGEWCWDYYDKDYYTKSPNADPSGPPSGTHRVVRGGSWLVMEVSSRCASRFMLSPGERDYSVGFRVARNP